MRQSMRLQFLTAVAAALLLASCAGGSSNVGTLLGSGETLAPGTSSSNLAALLMRADMLSAPAGDDVTYTILVRNTEETSIENAQVAVTLPLGKLMIREAVNGNASDDRIAWDIPRMMAGETRAFSYRAMLQTSLQTGDLVRTVVSFRADNLRNPATAQAEVRVGEAVAAAVTTGSSSSSDSPLSFFLGDLASSSSSSVAVPPSAPTVFVLPPAAPTPTPVQPPVAPAVTAPAVIVVPSPQTEPRMPQAGADDRFIAPREDTSKYLQPIR